MKYFSLDEVIFGIGGVEHGHADLRFSWDSGYIEVREKLDNLTLTVERKPGPQYIHLRGESFDMKMEAFLRNEGPESNFEQMRNLLLELGANEEIAECHT